MAATSDYYSVLRVARDASPAEIRAAFRARIRGCHPDRSTAEDANARSAAIIDAYRTLSDPDRRLGYDRRRAPARVAPFEPERRLVARRRCATPRWRMRAQTTLAALWATASTAIVLIASAPLLQRTDDLSDELVQEMVVAAPSRAG